MKIGALLLAFALLRAAVRSWTRAQLEQLEREQAQQERDQAATSAAADAAGAGPAGTAASTSAAAVAAQAGSVGMAALPLLLGDNLGRVVYCAQLQAGPMAVPDEQRRVWSALMSKYSGLDDPITGLMLMYPGYTLHVLEGDNNQLFGLLRELLPRDASAHGLELVRVPCFVLDVKQRLFERWQCAQLGQHGAPGNARRRALRAGLGAAASAASEAAADPRRQWLEQVQSLELFLKFVGPKLSSLASEGAARQALQHLDDFESSTPSLRMVEALAASEYSPELPAFLEGFDTDYGRYQALLASGVMPPDSPEMLHLGRYYGDHVKRDLEEAVKLQATAARAQAVLGVESALERLKSGMRLELGTHTAAGTAAPVQRQQPSP